MHRKILIVEDEPLIAEDIADIVTELGYTVIGMADSYEEVETLLQDPQFVPDIVLQDIQVHGDLDGVDIWNYVRTQRNCQVVFLTSFSDDKTINRVRAAQADGYIVKPFKREDLKTTLALLRQVPAPASADAEVSDRFIWVKDKHEHIKLDLKDILYLEAADNYCKVVTRTSRYLLSSPLKHAAEKLPDTIFYRCHRSFLVNVREIEKMGPNYLVIHGTEIPVNEAAKKEIGDLFSKF